MRAGLERGIDLEHVAADDAARRMHQHVVANARAFGVQPLQHAQRPVVAVERDCAFAVARVAQLQMAVPTHVACEPRCAQPVVRFSTHENNSYIAIAITPIVTSPAKASGRRCCDAADCIR